MQHDELKQVIQQFANRSVLVVGDVMLDQYTHGSSTRISPEAPVPIIRWSYDAFALGGAANVANNLAALGTRVVIAGVVGEDYYRDELIRLLSAAGVDSGGLCSDTTRPTTLKHRIVSDGHQMVRLDHEDVSPIAQEIRQWLIKFIDSKIADIDAVVLSDYDKGIFSKELVECILHSARQHDVKVIADLKPKNKDFFIGVDVVSPNLKEALDMSGASEVEEAGKILVDHFASDVVITRGGEGMSVFCRNGEIEHIQASKVPVFDITGAGDTVVATLALGIVSGLSVPHAALLGNYAGETVVQKPGTATLVSEELLAALQGGAHLEDTYKVKKVWGYEKWLENNEKYCCKLLSLKKGYQGSMHYHKIKDEMFLVISGHVRLELGDEVMHLRPGSYVRILPNTRHRFTGIEDSEIIEASTTHNDDDTYRLEESRKQKT